MLDPHQVSCTLLFDVIDGRLMVSELVSVTIIYYICSIFILVIGKSVMVLFPETGALAIMFNDWCAFLIILLRVS